MQSAGVDLIHCQRAIFQVLFLLFQVIETMKATGKDMMDKHKETSTGGLSVPCY